MLKNLPLVAAVGYFMTPEEEVLVSQAVFQNFVQEELSHVPASEDLIGGDHQGQDVVGNGLHGTPVLGQLNEEIANTPEGYKSVVVSEIGTKLRQIARDFEKSQERQAVKREADQVDLGHIDSNTFWGLLEEVFKHDINPYNLVALFYFCSDVLIRCVKQKMRELGLNLFKWALRYIATRVVKWVREQGGWEKVFKGVGTTIMTYFKLLGAAAVVVGVGYYSFKAIKN